MEAYCVKCKTKKEIGNPEPTFTSSGTPATRGKCPVCNTGLYRMGKTPAHEGLEKPEVQRKESKKKQRKRKGKLVIVESPAKAKTVGRILGKEFSVKASVGHVRDLLRSQISVDVENDFTPKYRVPNEKRKVVQGLKADSDKAAEVFIATDPDREGEAIAWHLIESAEIEPDIVKRVVFHEITKTAVEEAFQDTRNIDMDLVDAQQARRILDRLVGYNLSPLLWSKVRGRLSAGRVQSVALRMVVEREREIRDFIPQEYWTIDAGFVNQQKPPDFKARLIRWDGVKAEISNEAEVREIVEDLSAADYCVASVKHGKRIRKPAPPFTTSTLQQAASRRFNYTARKTMAVAQQLYEGPDVGEGDSFGLITYMRTDSTQVSSEAIKNVRQFIEKSLGSEFLPEKPVNYRSQVRGAQEAHEAIRPTSVNRTPEQIKSHLSADQYKLYDLIWRRFVASQTKPAEYDTLAIEIEGISTEHQSLFRVSASALRFPGFLEIYGDRDIKSEGEDNSGSDLKSTLSQLPDLVEGDPLDLIETFPDQHFTQHPPRFSDASLIKAMEEHGIGRPSTYAPTISTLRQRGYVIREKRRLYPTEIGEVVTDLLVEHFTDVLDITFTAKMEASLDEIASGKREWVDVIRKFYQPFSEELARAVENMPEIKTEPELLDRPCPVCGKPLLIRHGRYGKFVGCSDYPACRHTEPWLEKIGVSCPDDGGDLVERRTRKGRVFYGCSNYPECQFTSWKRPLNIPCPSCNGLLVVENRDQVVCISCESKFERSELPQTEKDTA
ncbi:MAG: type I DNA topoisomerase [Anaerolineales bacterium]